MFLQKLAQGGLITIEYYRNGILRTLKGRVYQLNLKKQVISLIDEKQVLHSIRLSGIKQIH
ncbi:YolD-like family protein [Neobacillus cucumis]|uniref:YolD-like family protein n=1 Tax=Neobacillus cucumis TaxID=1740721 RepID=UPI00203A4B09|nr:YolD-like family protein [Neobacillus cucumis]MCM3724778.1 YolD-like family protein [Neobacillus cucumis]